MKQQRGFRMAAMVCAVIASVALIASPTMAQEKTKLVVDGSTTVGPIAEAFAEYYMNVDTSVEVEVSKSGSGNGAKSLLNGNCDIAAMSRFMKESEFKGAVDNDVWPVAHVVALDGIAMVVHESNPVEELTMEQVKGIYLGRIKNWNEVGGPDMPIVMISRDTNSGTFETFEGLVMDKEKIAGEAEMVNSNGAMRQRVLDTQAAIGYVGLGYTEGVKPLKVNGIAATPETVSAGKYPIARPLYLFTNGYPELGSPLYTFVTLHLTEKGQEIVEDIGFVPVTKY